MSRYSPDFKKEVIEKVLSRKGRRIEEVGAEFGVPRATLFRWLKDKGVTAVITKPFSIQQLLATLEELTKS